MEIEGLVKRFGDKTAVNGVTFSARNGRVTGFLGPNGAGKSTTMKAMLGLIRPDAGRVLIDGRPYDRLSSPLRSVGAVLDARSAHKGMSAYAHLKALAASNGIPRSRVDEVVDITGIGSVKHRKAGSFSLGMSQRLSIAAALLGDPFNLVLDEPINGLDPEGVRWVRELCRYYASQGRAVLLSSHLMSEVALTADDLVIIGRGTILRTVSVREFVSEHSMHGIRVVTPDPVGLRRALSTAAGVRVEEVERRRDDAPGGQPMRIVGAPLESTARILAHHQVVLYQFVEERVSLEDAYMELTRGAQEYRAQSPVPVRRFRAESQGRENRRNRRGVRGGRR